jgi:uncharacterized protein (DUF885 family)
MNEELARLADEYWELELERSPTTGLFLGDYRRADEMEDLTRAAEDEFIERLDAMAAAAEAIDPATLSADEQVTRAVMMEEATGTATELRSRFAEFAVDPSSGLHVELLQLVGQITVPDADVADAIVTKWSRLGTTFDQALKRLRQGIARDRTPPAISVQKAMTQIADYLDSDLATDPFINLAPPPEFTDEQTAAWRDRLRTQVVESVRPGYAAYRDTLWNEVLEKSRPPERTGLVWLADGGEAYAGAIRRHTSLDLAPLDIHNIGLEEISQIRRQYRELGSRVLGTDNLTAIYQQLRNDPGLRFENVDQIVAAAQASMDRARAALPDWFGRLPETDCVMAQIPGPGAEEAPLAFYLPPTIDGTRPGTYFVNTTEPATRTRYESEALAFHESIPGHHLQIAIAQELEGIPEFRKHALMTAYVEGWGLYTERLADEMGLYSGDLERMGILSFDSWRAGRLVVDTGMHALGWSRDEAIEYLIMNSPQAPNNIETEIDRYIGWPGQALAYKLGQREIFRLRAEAQQRLGTHFDIKAFHDVVLDSGPVPLPLLTERVAAWQPDAAT